MWSSAVYVRVFFLCDYNTIRPTPPPRAPKLVCNQHRLLEPPSTPTTNSSPRDVAKSRHIIPKQERATVHLK